MATRDFRSFCHAQRELAHLLASVSITGATTASGALSLTSAAVTITASETGTARNTNTVTLQVLAAAANPTNKVLVTFSGTKAATVITVTPNDGTNNSATPVNLTSANLVELINTGLVTGKSITLTDAGSLRANMTAAGGDTTALADGGNGDGGVATLANGTLCTAISLNATTGGFSAATLASTGLIRLSLADRYIGVIKATPMLICSTAQDITMQVKLVTIAATPLVEIFLLKAGVVTMPTANATLKVDLITKLQDVK